MGFLGIIGIFMVIKWDLYDLIAPNKLNLINGIYMVLKWD